MASKSRRLRITGLADQTFWHMGYYWGKIVQPYLCTTTTLGNGKKWSLFEGGCYLEGQTVKLIFLIKRKLKFWQKRAKKKESNFGPLGGQSYYSKCFELFEMFWIIWNISNSNFEFRIRILHQNSNLLEFVFAAE
jgi:hypothetical protein